VGGSLLVTAGLLPPQEVSRPGKAAVAEITRLPCRLFLRKALLDEKEDIFFIEVKSKKNSKLFFQMGQFLPDLFEKPVVKFVVEKL
jgi:hypothetical protein